MAFTGKSGKFVYVCVCVYIYIYIYIHILYNIEGIHWYLAKEKTPCLQKSEYA